jgi:hypothetical protein
MEDVDGLIRGSCDYPSCSGSVDHIEVEDLASGVINAEPYIQDLEVYGWYHEEIHGNHAVSVIAKKGSLVCEDSFISWSFGDPA